MPFGQKVDLAYLQLPGTAYQQQLSCANEQ